MLHDSNTEIWIPKVIPVKKTIFLAILLKEKLPIGFYILKDAGDLTKSYWRIRFF